MYIQSFRLTRFYIQFFVLVFCQDTGQEKWTVILRYSPFMCRVDCSLMSRIGLRLGGKPAHESQLGTTSSTSQLAVNPLFQLSIHNLSNNWQPSFSHMSHICQPYAGIRQWSLNHLFIQFLKHFKPSTICQLSVDYISTIFHLYGVIHLSASASQL